MRDLPTASDIKESITDCNTWYRRFFRCWIDGSYLGYDHYQNNCDKVRSNYKSDRALRALAISSFCEFVAHEEDCSPSTVQRHLVREVSLDDLEALNVELIDDLRDLVRDEMEVA
jgi:hypothetical protein